MDSAERNDSAEPKNKGIRTFNSDIFNLFLPFHSLLVKTSETAYFSFFFHSETSLF